MPRPPEDCTGEGGNGSENMEENVVVMVEEGEQEKKVIAKGLRPRHRWPRVQALPVSPHS